MHSLNILRLHHIDLLRGLIILFMIVDHAMVYCADYLVNDPMDIPGTEPKVFFSRFISHFCAPLFVFLAGLSAALTESRYTKTRDFAKNLIMRGCALLLLEFTLVSWSWSFNPLFPMLYAQVIWAIGWGFIILGLLRLANVKLVFIVGLVIVFGHNLLDGVRFQDNTTMHYLWSALHQKNVLTLPFGFKIRTTYPFLPIAGLMCVAYIIGRYYASQQFSRKTETQALWLGTTMLLGYCVLRGFNLYGDASQFIAQESFILTTMSFLNPTKYPLSLQFILLTVGCGLVALSLLARSAPTFSANFLQILGKTSMFSYLAHLYLLHLISWLLIPVLGYSYNNMTYGSTLIGLPEGFGLSYGATWLMATAVALLTVMLAKLYIPWKKTHKNNLIAKYI